MNICALTKMGKNKTHSEDRIVIDDIVLNDESVFLKNVNPQLIGIADGVGGNAGGELAAQFVCERALKLVGENILKQAAEINMELLEYAAETDGKEKMASTFSAVVFGAPDRMVHIGNTRIYTLQGKYLKQLTNDHTTYNALLYRGLYEAAENCNKSEITACMGGGTYRFFEPDTAALSEFNSFIMTSDGVHDFLDIDEIEDIVNSEASLTEKCTLLAEKALSAGSADDISIIIAENNKLL